MYTPLLAFSFKILQCLDTAGTAVPLCIVCVYTHLYHTHTHNLSLTLNSQQQYTGYRLFIFKLMYQSIYFSTIELLSFFCTPVVSFLPAMQTQRMFASSIKRLKDFGLVSLLWIQPNCPVVCWTNLFVGLLFLLSRRGCSGCLFHSLVLLLLPPLVKVV